MSIDQNICYTMTHSMSHIPQQFEIEILFSLTFLQTWTFNVTPMWLNQAPWSWIIWFQLSKYFWQCSIKSQRGFSRHIKFGFLCIKTAIFGFDNHLWTFSPHELGEHHGFGRRLWIVGHSKYGGHLGVCSHFEIYIFLNLATIPNFPYNTKIQI